MPDEALITVPPAKPRRAWLWSALLVTGAGTVAAVVFASYWFNQGGCGLVRFYDHLVGVIVLGGWLAGSVVGLASMFYGRAKRSGAFVRGALIAIAVNLVMLVGSMRTVWAFCQADYSFKSTEQLCQMLTDPNWEVQTLAAHQLGERRAVEAVAQLCAILNDGRANLNLRHNAAIALGKICAPPWPPAASRTADLDRALTSLTQGLASRDEYLPVSIAEALGQIGDSRAVEPLTQCVNDPARPSHVREAAVRALGRIPGDQATGALRFAHTSVQDPDLARLIDRTLAARQEP